MKKPVVMPAFFGDDISVTWVIRVMGVDNIIGYPLPGIPPSLLLIIPSGKGVQATDLTTFRKLSNLNFPTSSAGLLVFLLIQ